MILVQISSFKEAILHKCHLKARYSSAFWLGFSFLIFSLFTSALLSGCGSSKHIQTVPIETIRDHQVHDTLYINNVQYDSIFISQKTYTDRTKDTLLIRQHDIEYRYKLLRDTIYRTKVETVRDSIPYEVRIIESKETPYKRHWLDWVSDISFVILTFLTGWRIYRLFK